MIKLNRFNVLNFNLLNNFLSFYNLIQYDIINYYFSYMNNLNFFYNNKYIYFKNLLFVKKNNSMLPTHFNFSNDYKYLNLNKNYKINYFENLIDKSNKYTTLSSKKKFKKTVLFNRKILNILNCYNVKNSSKLSRSIINQSKININNRFINFQFNIFILLLNYKFIKNIEDYFLLLRNRQIFINRNSITKSQYFLKKGDLIELSISNLYKFYYKNIVEIQNKSLMRFKFKLWKNIRQNKNILIDKNFLKLNAFKLNIIDSYVEIDFLTLSIFIIHKNINMQSLYLLSKIYPVYLYKLCNWFN